MVLLYIKAVAGPFIHTTSGMHTHRTSLSLAIGHDSLRLRLNIDGVTILFGYVVWHIANTVK